jgi:hypothetical protein
MKKAKIIIIAIVTLLALIVFLQNTETVETKFLFTKNIHAACFTFDYDFYDRICRRADYGKSCSTEIRQAE